MRHIFITGVSTGIGNALAAAYLDRGDCVYGVSRRVPETLVEHANFTFASHDLRDHEGSMALIPRMLLDTPQIDLAVLNAGALGAFGDIGSAELDEMKDVTEINLWANKTVLDALFSLHKTVQQVVTISSGAAVNGNRGWQGYAISKAALNMLTKLYAAERPEAHFCALAPGIIDTAMQEDLCGRPPDPRYPSLEALRSKRSTPEMPSAEEAAGQLIEVFERARQRVGSGEFADIRKPPLAD